jgi:hypothetical protein
MTPASLPALPSLPRPAAVLLVGLLVAKLALLAALGPALFPDSALYLELGRAVLDDPGWWRDSGWGTSFAPPALLRPWGYPLLIAAAHRLAGDGFGTLLCAIQCLASTAVLAMLGRLAQHLLDDGRRVSALLLLASLSGFVLFDGALLTDSLYTDLFLAVMVTLASRTLCGPAPGLVLGLVLGLAWAASLSLRDVGLYHTLLPLAALVLAARRHGLARLRMAGLAACFLIPIACYVGLVMGWNELRTGHPFFSITGGVNWLWPSVNIADRGLAQPFDCSDPVCLAARRHGVAKGMEGVNGLAEALWQDGGLDPVALGKVTLAHALGVARTHPVAFVASVLGNLQPAHLADLAFNPLANLNELTRLHSSLGARLVPAPREALQGLRHGVWALLPVLILEVPLSGAALAGLALFVVGVPLAAWRRGLGGAGLTVVFLWATAILFIASYSLVHLEMRHAMPVIPLVLLATLWAARRAGGGTGAKSPAQDGRIVL